MANQGHGDPRMDKVAKTAPQWLTGIEICGFSLQQYSHLDEYRCDGCDRAICCHCITLIERRVFCPECATEMQGAERGTSNLERSDRLQRSEGAGETLLRGDREGHPLQSPARQGPTARHPEDDQPKHRPGSAVSGNPKGP